jgi:hypothetical protein
MGDIICQATWLAPQPLGMSGNRPALQYARRLSGENRLPRRSPPKFRHPHHPHGRPMVRGSPTRAEIAGALNARLATDGDRGPDSG